MRISLIRQQGVTSAAFDEVQVRVLAFLPRGFPVADAASGLAFSEALFLVPKNLLHKGRPTYRCAVDLLEQGDVYNRLGSRTTSGILSVFDRLGIVSGEGHPVVVTSRVLQHTPSQ
jgi:hypothetical protein